MQDDTQVPDQVADAPAIEAPAGESYSTESADAELLAAIAGVDVTPAADVEAAAAEPEAAEVAAPEAAAAAPVAAEPAADAWKTEYINRMAALEAKLAAVSAPAAAAPPPFDQPQAMGPVATAEDFQLDPVGTLRRLGIDPNYVANHMVVDFQGDKADPAMRAQLGMTPHLNRFQQQTQAQFAALQQELTTMKQREVAAKIEAESTRFLSAAPSTELPYVSRAFKRNPEKISQEIMAIVRQDALERGLTLNDKPLPPSEAAKRYEAQLKAYADLVAEDKAQAISTPPPVAANKKPAATAGNLSGSAPRQAASPPTGNWLDDVHAQLVKELEAELKA